MSTIEAAQIPAPPDTTPIRWQKVIVTPNVSAAHPAAIMIHTENVVLSRNAPEARALAADLMKAADRIDPAESIGSAAPIVQIKRAHSTSRSYDAIVVHIGGMSFSRDLLNSRDVRLAKQLADRSGGEFWVSPDLQARVDAALAEGRRRG